MDIHFDNVVDIPFPINNIVKPKYEYKSQI